MNRPAHLILALALTVSCVLGQLDSPPRQSISSSGNVLRNNRNPTTTQATAASAAAAVTATTASQPATDTTIMIAPESATSKSQILTPLRTNTRQTSTTVSSTVAGQTVTVSPVVSAPSSSPVVEEPEEVADPMVEDLCILTEDVYRVNASEWFSDSCQKKCRCVFRNEPRDPRNDISILRSENWKPNSVPTEIRCSLPEQCADIADKLVPSKRCPEPTMIFTSTSFETCECPQISCGLRANSLAPTTWVVAPTTITTPPPPMQITSTVPPTTTTRVTSASITTSTPNPATTAKLATKLIAPATTTTAATAAAETVVATTLTSAPAPTNFATETATTFVAATERATQMTPTETTTSAGASIRQTPAATTTTTTGDQQHQNARVAPSSIMQAIDAPLEKYAAHLLIALALMTTLFVVVSFMYLRRSFRSSMVYITEDCYENPAFTKGGPLIDVIDQNSRNKNKEVDGFSPQLRCI